MFITVNSIKWLSVAEPHEVLFFLFFFFSSLTIDSRNFENNNTSFTEDELFGKKLQIVLIPRL